MIFQFGKSWAFEGKGAPYNCPCRLMLGVSKIRTTNLYQINEFFIPFASLLPGTIVTSLLVLSIGSEWLVILEETDNLKDFYMIFQPKIESLLIRSKFQLFVFLPCKIS